MASTPTPRKVLRIIDRLNVGGPAIHVTLLSRDLDRLGESGERWQTVLVYGQEGMNEGNMLSLVRQAGVNTVFIPSLGRELNPFYDLISLWKVLRVLWREKPQIVHTHKSKAGVIGRLAAVLAGVPVRVHTYHGHVLHGYFSALKSRLFIWIERVMGLMTDSLIAVSPRVKDDLVQYSIAPSDKINVLYLGLELHRFKEQSRGQGQLRRELGLPADTPVVGIVARLAPIKRISVFLRAAHGVATACPSAHFVIIGDGELRGDLEADAQKLGLSGRVHFMGFRDDLDVLYPDIDVLTLTSSNEGSPVSLIEGLAAGCAVVSTRVGGVPDVVQNGETGWLVNPPAPDAPDLTAQLLSQKIIELLKDPTKRRTAAEKGQQDVMNRFDIGRLVQDIARLYRDLLQRKLA
jgi:glycosyltransferase involved in cell wall biosynthesis